HSCARHLAPTKIITMLRSTSEPLPAPRQAVVFPEHGSLEPKTAWIWFVSALRPANSKQSDDLGFIWDAKFAFDCGWIKTFHGRGIKAIRLSHQHKYCQGNHGVAIDPNIHSQMGQKFK